MGLLLTSGGSAFGLIYATTGLATLTLTLRGPIVFSLGPQASVGLAGLALTTLGSFSAIVAQQLKPPQANVGASLVIWTNFVIILIGDILFYAGYVTATALLVGLVSAALTIASLVAITGRPRAGALSG